MKAINVKVYEIFMNRVSDEDLASPISELTKQQLDQLVEQDKASVFDTLGEFQAAFNGDEVSDLNYIRFASDDDIDIYL